MPGLEFVQAWHWMILGVVLLILEILAPGAILMWFGFGAFVSGFLLWLFPSMGIGIQLLVFAVFSGLSLTAWHMYRKKNPAPESDQPGLNNRLHSHIGKEYTLREPIKDGVGILKIGDSVWKIRGKDLPAGTRVRISGLDGILFIVEEV
jgi:membrane protein implicated in regulation of membrane protease activity